MKKKIAILLVLAMTLASLTACSDSSSSKKKSRDKSKKTKVERDIDDTDVTDDTDDTEPTTEATTTTTAEPEVNIVPTENANITWKDVSSPEGYIKMKIPEGWTATFNNIDTIGYEIKVQDPSQQKSFYFCTSVVSYPSWDNFQYWRKAGKQYGLSLGDTAYISPKSTVESLFENSKNFFGYDTFTILDNLGENGYGGDILKAKAVYGDKEYEGIFTSSLVDIKLYYDQMDWDLASGTTVMLLPQEDFTDWIGVMLQIFASLEFTQDYYQARNRAWQQVYGNSQAIMYYADQISAIIMDSWERSNRSSDITTQAYCDAVLGRDRVYDTTTGNVYYTPVGWMDNYTGTRFQTLSTGSDYYLKPVTGKVT